MRFLPALLMLPALVFAAENQLTPAEKKEGWTLLFDGKTMKGWRDPAKKVKPGNGWKIEDASLATVKGPQHRRGLDHRQELWRFRVEVRLEGVAGRQHWTEVQDSEGSLLRHQQEDRGPGGFEGMLGREMANPKADRKTLAPGRQRVRVYDRLRVPAYR